MSGIGFMCSNHMKDIKFHDDKHDMATATPAILAIIMVIIDVSLAQLQHTFLFFSNTVQLCMMQYR